MASAAHHPPPGARDIASWAVYLACSWTWCIGMFLPVLLVRDYGFWAWVAFIVPNVIGAGAVGFFSYRRADGRSLLDGHHGAMQAFSIVTVLFHIFFAAWLIPLLIGRWGVVLAFAATALFYGYFHRERTDRRATLLTLGLSVAAALVCLANFRAMPSLPGGLATSATQGRGLACLAPGIAFGFLLCPHLDLTLQRARKAQTPRNARWSFVLGFGVVFVLMVLFTLYYAGAVVRAMEGGGGGGGGAAGVALAVRIAVGVYMAVQAALTTALHLRELPLHRATRRHPFEMMGVLLAVALELLLLSRPAPTWWGLSAGEVIYRGFLGFYGLAFPAYIWLAMVWRRGRAPTRATLVTVLLVVLAIVPFFAVAFIGRRAWWALPGLGLLLVSPVVLPRVEGQSTLETPGT